MLSPGIHFLWLKRFLPGWTEKPGLVVSIWTPLKVFSTVCVQTTGFSLALGMVVHGLSMCGHGKAEDIHPHLLASWMKILLAEVLLPFFF